MPDFTIDAPAGAKPHAKEKMQREITEALDETYAHAADEAEPQPPASRVRRRGYATGDTVLRSRLDRYEQTSNPH